MTTMTAKIRLPRSLRDLIMNDLQRRHPHAAERVGFAYGRVDLAADNQCLVLIHSYEPVPEERYIKDAHTGARIDSNQIRQVLERVLSTGDSAFHVHLHPWAGMPGFSGTDSREIPRLIKSFTSVAPKTFHGAVLLSTDRTSAAMWHDGQALPASAVSFTVIGFPVELNNGISCEEEKVGAAVVSRRGHR